MRRTAPHLLLYLLPILISNLSIAADFIGPEAGVTALVQQAHSRQLATHPYWSALMHYQRKTSVVAETVVSEISSPEFFLSPEGATNPAAELAATLVAFFVPVGEGSDTHALCRFPARYKWLRKTLDWGSLEPPRIQCRKYNAYTMNNQIDSLSLVYVTGYPTNPASFYGHLLLKFNFRRAAVAIDLLDHSLTFGAAIPASEVGFIYVIKGLFGGYDGVFSHRNFYAFNHAYVENELRDMWEYELILSEDEIDQIVSHSWELLGRKYVYYFFKENCAYRMAELLELVIDPPLLPNVPWALPETLFENIAALNRNGAPVVRKITRIPSRQNRFRDQFLAMPDDQQFLTRQLVDGPLNLDGVGYQTLPATKKIAIIDTLLDYYEYRIITDKGNIEFRRAKQELLIERTGLPVQTSVPDGNTVFSLETAPPHRGPPPSMVRLGPIYNSQFGTGLELRIRPVNYDRLELDAGRLPNSTLTMFDLKTVYLDNRLGIRSLDFVKIENFNLPKTPLPDDGGFAWNFKVGYESQNLACSGCMIFNLVGGLGKAAQLTEYLVVFGMLDLFAQTPHQNSGSLGALPQIGLVASPTVGWKSSIMIGRQSYLNGSRLGNRVVRLENRIGSSRNWDIRISYEEHVAHEFLAAVSLYW
jgi:hypothetical protein